MGEPVQSDWIVGRTWQNIWAASQPAQMFLLDPGKRKFLAGGGQEQRSRVATIEHRAEPRRILLRIKMSQIRARAAIRRPIALH